MKATFHARLMLVCLAGLACAGKQPEGIYYASGGGAVTPDGLHRVEWEPFRVSYVKPGADLQRYDKVLVQQVTVSYKTPPRAVGLSTDEIDPNYALSDAAMESLKRFFHEAFVTELGRSKNFSVVDAPGPDVLLISGHVIDLQIQVPPEQDPSLDETSYTAASGQMTLVLDARDSTSGEPLVRVGQARAIQMSDSGWYAENPVNSSGAVRQTFQTWASDLRRELDQLHALPALPPVATKAPPS